MASKQDHLTAILAQRLSWTAADKLAAERLAGVRAQIEKLDRRLDREGYTVSTAAGGVKSNPAAAARERLAKEDGHLTRRLQLGAVRIADNGRSYKAATSPVETRERLRAVFGDDCQPNLIPGMWLHWTKMYDCEIAEDSVAFPNDPTELPVPGQAPSFGSNFPVIGPGAIPATCGERQVGWEGLLPKLEALAAR